MKQESKLINFAICGDQLVETVQFTNVIDFNF